MKAVRFESFGDSSVLELVDVPIPTPGPGEILVKMVATGVNFIEIYQRTGIYSVDLPCILGAEGMGVVEAVGEGVTSVQPGQRVAFTDAKQTYAEYVVLPAQFALSVPEGIDDLTAAALPLQGLTAHYLSHSTFALAPEHTALIHAGAGGVGQILIQLAKLRGARVFTTVSTKEKAALATEAGADEVLEYENFSSRVRELTRGKGVNVVYDGVGKATFDQSLDSLAKRGTMALFGASSGPVPDFNLQRLNSGGSLFITRPTLWDYLLTPEERQWRWNDLTDAVLSGKLNIRIGATYPLEQARQAHDDLAGRKTTGKVLLLP